MLEFEDTVSVITKGGPISIISSKVALETRLISKFVYRRSCFLRLRNVFWNINRTCHRYLSQWSSSVQRASSIRKSNVSDIYSLDVIKLLQIITIGWCIIYIYIYIHCIRPLTPSLGTLLIVTHPKKKELSPTRLLAELASIYTGERMMQGRFRFPFTVMALGWKTIVYTILEHFFFYRSIEKILLVLADID